MDKAGIFKNQRADGRATPWSRLRLHSPGWREDQHHELNEVVPPGRLGRDLVALGCALLLAAVGLRVWLARSGARTEVAGAAVPAAPAFAPPGGAARGPR